MSHGLLLPEGTTKRDLKEFFWNRGNLSWKLHSTQKIIHDAVDASGSDEILIFSSRQLGKSWWAVCYAIEYCLRNKGVIVRILSDTLKHVQDIVNDNLNAIIADAPHGLIERHKTSYRWTIGSSSLRLGPLERAYVDYNRGGNASLIICEEGGFVKSDDYDYAIKSVIGPQLLRSSGKLIHVTTPSEDPLHIIHTEILPKTRLKNAYFNYTIYDNPQITEEQIRKAKELCGGEGTAAWKREYLAQIVRDPSSVVVPTFDRVLHVREFLLPEYSNYQVSIDFGGVRDKTVALLYTYDFQENTVMVIDERMFPANTPTDTIVSGIREMESQVESIADRWADCPGQLQIDLNKVGFPIKVPHKLDWQAGINHVQVEFGQGRVLVDPKCQFLAATLEAGMYNKNRTDFERSETLGHCDAIAALSYALRMLNRKNPYPDYIPPRSRYLDLRDNRPPELVAMQSIAPKQLGSFSGSSGLKRLGSFKHR